MRSTRRVMMMMMIMMNEVMCKEVLQLMSLTDSRASRPLGHIRFDLF